MSWTGRLRAGHNRLMAFGIEASDDEELRANKATLTLVSVLITVLGFVWTITYLVAGRPWSAAIPFAYQLISVVSLIVFARTKHFRTLRFTQLIAILVLPFALQWSLGGYARGSAVAMWALTAPAFAFMFGARPLPWLGGFIGLAVVSGVAESWLNERVTTLSPEIITPFFVLNMFGAGVTYFLALLYFSKEREKARAALAVEQRKSDALLLNILPGPIAERLKEGERVIADAYSAVTVLFIDIVGFTSISAQMLPADVVESLNDLFSDLDDLADLCGLEKIKTIGDGYQAVAGAPLPRRDHVAAVADMALLVQRRIAGRPFGPATLSLRMGIDTGPAVAAVIGKRKFSYDLWGDVVNTASRMESHGVPDRIQVTERVYETLRDRYAFEPRGVISVKGKGDMETYFLISQRADAPATG